MARHGAGQRVRERIVCTPLSICRRKEKEDVDDLDVPETKKLFMEQIRL